VVERLDHKNFNMDVPEMENVMPSIENIVRQIWRWLAPHITGCNCTALS
jgi:6-pyruvoyltetrahydropterin/6-carboxytetrahydropterin synthase